LKEPGTNGNLICTDGHACCPEGVWSCSIGDGITFPCDNGDFIENPTGEVCPPEIPVEPKGCCEPLKEPGTNGNLICTDGHACCPEGVWSCSIGDGITFPCDNGDLIENPTGEVCTTTQEEEPCCNPDLEFACLFGSPACCSDGQWACPDGETDLYPCAYAADPQGPICLGLPPNYPGGDTPGDEENCDPALKPDGNNGGSVCTDGFRCCPNGKWTCGIGDGTFPCDGTGPSITTTNMECDPDLEPGKNGNPICSEDHECCGDGYWLCGIGDGTNPCADGAVLVLPPAMPGTRTSGCDAALEPGTNDNPFCTDGYDCCADGNWLCGIGDGSPPCGDQDTNESPLPLTKQACCDPEAQPEGCFEGLACCPDGKWGCSIGDATNFACGNDVIEKPNGPVCGENASGCCDSVTMPLCLIGSAACCPQGTWACPNGLTNLYPCGRAKNPAGPVCSVIVDTAGENNCFPGDSTVHVMGRGSILMKHLKLSDQVLTQSGTYSKVYSFGHYQPEANLMYMQLYSKETTLQISKDHMVFINAATSVAAGSLNVGDTVLLGAGKSTSITRIDTGYARGAFAPFTESGSIVVNDVLVSNYIAMDDQHHKLTIFGIALPVSYQWMAHASQVPHRIYCRLGGGCRNETYTTQGVSHWVATPYLVVKFLLQQHSLIQALVFLCMLPVFAFFVIFEVTVVTSVLVPVLTVGTYFWMRSNKATPFSKK